MPTNLIVLIATLIIALLLFKALLNFLKTAFSTAIAIAIIVVILMIFGVTPENLLDEIVSLIPALRQPINELRQLFN